MAEPMNAAEVALLNDRNEILHEWSIKNMATVKGMLSLYK